MKLPQLAADVVTVDIGNSKISAACFVGGRLQGFYRVDARALSASTLTRALSQVFDAAGLERSTPVLIASVVPERTRVVVHALRKRKHQPRAVHVASARDPWPFTIALEEKARIGVDRLANIAGLCARGHRDGVVVDAGTAITIDVLQRGRFAGGFILPGFDLQLQALHTHTAKLPRLKLGHTPPPPLGTDTESAMRGGVYWVTSAGAATVAHALAAGLGAERGAGRGAGRGGGLGAERGAERGAGRGAERGGGLGAERGAERGAGRGAGLATGAPILTTGGAGGAIALALGDPGCEDPDLQMTGLRFLQARLQAGA